MKKGKAGLNSYVGGNFRKAWQAGQVLLVCGKKQAWWESRAGTAIKPKMCHFYRETGLYGITMRGRQSSQHS